LLLDKSNGKFLGGWSIALLAGGNWNNSSYCGSRSRNGNNGRGTVNANNGRRGACDIWNCEKLHSWIGSPRQNS